MPSHLPLFIEWIKIWLSVASIPSTLNILVTSVVVQTACHHPEPLVPWYSHSYWFRFPLHWAAPPSHRYTSATVSQLCNLPDPTRKDDLLWPSPHSSRILSSNTLACHFIPWDILTEASCLLYLPLGSCLPSYLAGIPWSITGMNLSFVASQLLLIYSIILQLNMHIFQNSGSIQIPENWSGKNTWLGCCCHQDSTDLFLCASLLCFCVFSRQILFEIIIHMHS